MVDLSVFDDVASGGDINKVKALAAELESLEEKIDGLSETLKSVQARKREILEGDLPEEMAALGLETFKLDTGFKIEIKEVVAGSLPKDPVERQRAFDLIRQYEADGLIKNEMSLLFERGQDNEAKSLLQDLIEEGYNVSLTENIHPQTLAAFVRERLSKGEDVNYKALGVYVAKQAKVGKAKK